MAQDNGGPPAKRRYMEIVDLEQPSGSGISEGARTASAGDNNGDNGNESDNIPMRSAGNERDGSIADHAGASTSNSGNSNNQTSDEAAVASTNTGNAVSQPSDIAAVVSVVANSEVIEVSSDTSSDVEIAQSGNSGTMVVDVDNARSDTVNLPSNSKHNAADDHDVQHNPANRQISNDEILESISKILSCAFCQKIPKPKDLVQFKCQHPMCDECAFVLMANATLTGQTPVCTACYTVMKYDDIRYNQSVKLFMEEMSTTCEKCLEKIICKNLLEHMERDCPKRLTLCKYISLGCTWQGAWDACAQHELTCDFPHKNAKQIVVALSEMKKRSEEKCDFIFKFSVAPFANYLDLKLSFRSARIFQIQFFYNSNISFFEHEWMLRASVNANHPNHEINYCLEIKTAPSEPLLLHYFINESPFEKLKIIPNLCKHTFDVENLYTTKNDMGIVNRMDRNRVLAQKSFYIRLFVYHF